MNSKNGLMLYLSGFTVLMAIIVFVLHQILGIFDSNVLYQLLYSQSDYSKWAKFTLLMTPILLLFIAFIAHRKNSKSTAFWITLTMTFSSIAIIAVGDGMIEYHFSIFMILAFLINFDSIKLILISTVIFAVQHFGFFFLAPELLCGSSGNYTFSILLIHAIFLILTSAVACLIIYQKNSYASKIEAERDAKANALESSVKSLEETGQQVMGSVANIRNQILTSEKNNKNTIVFLKQLVEGSDQQVQDMEQSNEMLKEMTQAIKQMASSAELVSEKSTDTTETSRVGSQTAQKTVNFMNDVKQSVSKAATVIENLDRKSTDINAIISVISNIADQTNLLALNAAIEASRAGDAGRGFAVVADEIRKLAEESNSSAKEIASIINEIGVEMKNSLEAIKDGVINVDQGIASVNDVDATFKEIVSANESIENQIMEVTAVTEQITASSTDISQFVDKVTSIAKEISEKSSEIETNSTYQTESINTISELADGLEQLSKKLIINDTM